MQMLELFLPRPGAFWLSLGLSAKVTDSVSASDIIGEYFYEIFYQSLTNHCGYQKSPSMAIDTEGSLATDF